MHTGLAADELYSTDGFANRWALDRRVFSYEKSNSESDCSFEFLQRARAEALSAADLFSQTAQRNSARHGELYLIAGFSTLILAENFCSGVPLSRVVSDGTFQYGGPLPTAQIYAVPRKISGQWRGGASAFPFLSPAIGGSAVRTAGPRVVRWSWDTASGRSLFASAAPAFPRSARRARLRPALSRRPKLLNVRRTTGAWMRGWTASTGRRSWMPLNSCTCTTYLAEMAPWRTGRRR